MWRGRCGVSRKGKKQAAHNRSSMKIAGSAAGSSQRVGFRQRVDTFRDVNRAATGWLSERGLLKPYDVIYGWKGREA